MVGAQLIPGLHNELAMEVLLRVPEEYHYVAMEASSLWRIVLCSDGFHVLRRLRSKRGCPALLLVLEHGHGLLKLNLALASSGPCCILSSRSIGTLACLRGNSVLILDHDGWMKFDISSEKWTKLPHPDPLPFLLVYPVKLLGVVDARVFVAAHTTESPYSRVAVSYDYSLDRWDSHEGLPHNFSIESLQFTFQGQIFIRLDREPVPSVYAFDLVTNRWKEHEHMTKRLAMLPMCSRVAATYDGTLISATHDGTSMWSRERSTWKIEVKKQDEGSFEWCNLLRVLVDERGHFHIKYFLFIEENHIFLVTEGKKGTEKMCTREEHVVGQHYLTCVYVPEYSLKDAALIYV